MFKLSAYNYRASTLLSREKSINFDFFYIKLEINFSLCNRKKKNV